MKKLLTILLSLAPLFCVARTETPPAEPDSLTQREKMAQQLIETVTELSRTASKLSDAVNLILSPASGSKTTEKVPAPTEKPDTAHPYADPAIPANCEGPYQKPDTPTPPRGDNGVYLGPDITTKQRPFPFIGIPGDEAGKKGNYLWVPDSIQDQVLALLEGKLKTRKATSGPEGDLNQKVIFRGDTLDMVIRSRNFGRFDRKLFNYLSVPKGIWGASLTASYGELSTEDLEMLSVLSNMTLSGHIFSIKPAIRYFIRNNIALGVRLSYTQGKATVNSFKVDIDEDMNFNLNDIMYRTESYQAGFTVTRYLGLAPRSRFSLTNELELGFSSGNSDFRRPFGGVLKETHTTTMKASITYSPGVSVLMMKNVSFDLSFGAFGVYLQTERQWTDGLKGGTRTSSGANFKFNIFNLNFGIGVRI